MKEHKQTDSLERLTKRKKSLKCFTGYKVFTVVLSENRMKLKKEGKGRTEGNKEKQTNKKGSM